MARKLKEPTPASVPNDPAADRPKAGNGSSPEEMRKRHEQRKSWFIAEASRQAVNRALMARCEAFYDSEQWKHDEAEAVRARGQNPCVYNEVKPVIDWLIGTERRTRVDFYVMAEDEGDAADDDAKAKSKLLKYLDDCNRAAFERSYAAEDAFKAGMGWIEVGLRGDKSGVPIYVGAESWRHVLWDSQSQKRDLSDARYLFRIKVVDRDVAEALFPDKADELAKCVQTGDNLQVFSEWLGGTGLITGIDQFGNVADELDYLTPKPIDLFNARERILLLECWSREPMPAKLDKDGLGDPVTFRMRVSIMTEHDTLIEAWSPFKHDGWPFIPVWGYRNRRTGLPYSPIFPLLGPQEGLNHRMSRTLYEASANQLMAEKGAIDKSVMDVNELRDELNDPNGIAIFADGALAGRKVQDRENPNKAQQQLALAERDIGHIRQISGIDAAARGIESPLKSGIALKTNNENTSLLSAELFDYLLLARQMEGDLTLSLAEQYIVQPMTVRVAGEGGSVERLRINDPMPDGTYKNDITARKAHFVVGEQAWKQSYAEAAFESLMQVLTQLASAAPQVVVALLDVVFDMHPNLPRKKAILERIRQVNGQTAPDGKMTPEQAAALQQKQRVAQAQFEAQMAQLQADVKEAQAKGLKLDAEAVLTKVTTLYEAAQTAQVLAAMPTATPIADEVLRSVGFQDMGGSGDVIDLPNQQPAPQLPRPPELQQADGAAVGHQAGIGVPNAPEGTNLGA